MPRTTIQPDGRVTYRTSLFRSLQKAQSFARCLTANNGRFERTMVHASATSKTPSWFVTFEPVAESRKDAVHAGQQDIRRARAQEAEFIFWPDGDRINIYWCFSCASGETYEVTLGDCSCADYTFRCRYAGLHCKHMIAWSAQVAAGTLSKTDKTTQTGRPIISREEIARRIAQDF